jgi:hypothetical protein
MLVFNEGSILPLEALSLMEEVKGDRAFFSTIDGISPTIFIVLNDIRAEEIKSFQSDLTLRASTFKDIAFLHTNFSLMNFDMPIVTSFIKDDVDASKIGSALTLVLVEENGYIIRGMRALEMSSDIMYYIHQCRNITLSQAQEFSARCISVLKNADTNTVFKDGAVQKLLRG